MKVLLVLLQLSVLANCSQQALIELSSSSLCSDDFNRDDSTTLGENWQLEANGSGTGINIDIKGNQAVTVLPSSASLRIALCKTKIDQAKTEISLEVVDSAGLSAPDIFTIVARSSASNSAGNSYACGVDNGNLVIYQSVRALKTTLATGSAVTLTAGTLYTFKFTLNNNSLTCSVSGGATATVTATDTTYATGYAGFLIQRNSAATLSIDNFTVNILK